MYTKVDALYRRLKFSSHDYSKAIEYMNSFNGCWEKLNDIMLTSLILRTDKIEGKKFVKKYLGWN